MSEGDASSLFLTRITLLMDTTLWIPIISTVRVRSRAFLTNWRKSFLYCSFVDGFLYGMAPSVVLITGGLLNQTDFPLQKARHWRMRQLMCFAYDFLAVRAALLALFRSSQNLPTTFNIAYVDLSKLML